MSTPTSADLRPLLAEVALADSQRLGRRLDGLRSQKDPARREQTLTRLAAELETAAARLAARAAAVPTVTYPAELPVSQAKDELLAAIRDHQVVVVAGETGSGKTTQLPKICLELGRGVRGMIGHTQPRRIAARSVATRIAEELGTELGDAVGYAVRFTDQVSDGTYVKLMTDGILLAEIQRDRMLWKYDTIIVDEAHERSLNIDFLLGYLRQLLPRRPDLKVIITSATIDPGKFAKHFRDAPVVEVSGRTYPVEVRYRPFGPQAAGAPVDDDEPLGEPDDRDQTTAVGDAVVELSAEGPGDILVFLSGEREIRDTADHLGKLGLRHTEVLPLYARLSTAEQQRVFSPHTGRRVVLATNVAETSLTVPGIRYVIDPGTARISRYSQRTKVQRLPIEPVSRASADQRKGRCGRLEAGICIRLYPEADYESRPQFTEPEVLRTGLASVILQMTSLGLGEVEDFGFLDPPEARSIRDGVAVLTELGALDPTQTDQRKRLTPIGRQLAQLPIDPRLARMVVEADRQGCLPEVLVIAAALSIQDPRERPADAQPQAAQAHARFADPKSDFVSYLLLWRYLREQQRELGSSAFRRLCKTEYLHYLRVREWQDLHGQLRQVARSIGLETSGAVEGDAMSAGVDTVRVHSALLAGLLSHVGVREGEAKDYLGARGARFSVGRESAVAKSQPRFVVAAELVETNRLWARTVARVEPEWVEAMAGHLVLRVHSEPHWEAKRGAVMAFERVTLFGVPLVARRKVGYADVDPELCREMFIRHALVEGEWRTHHSFFHDNLALLEQVESLEQKTRRRDLRVDAETLLAVYDARLPAEVVSARHFDAWWKVERRSRPDLLTFTLDDLLTAAAGEIDPTHYPEVWTSASGELELAYSFAPGEQTDGITVTVPVALLAQVGSEEFEWPVPGLRFDLVVALLRSLPKSIRRALVPVPDTAHAALAQVRPGEEGLLDGLERALLHTSGVDVPREAWDWERVPDHLRMTFSVVDDDGAVLGEGKDLEVLRRELAPQARAAVADVAGGLERSGLRAWPEDLPELPRSVRRSRAGHVVEGFPALVDEGAAGVAVRVLATAPEQATAHRRGTRALLLAGLPDPVKGVQKGLSNPEKLALARAPHGGVGPLVADCAAAVVDDVVARAGGPAYDEVGFARLLAACREELFPGVVEVLRDVQQVLRAAADVDRASRGAVTPSALPSVADVRDQLARRFRPGFVAETGRTHLPGLARHLQALNRRLERLERDPVGDRSVMARVAEVEAEVDKARRRLPPGHPQALAPGRERDDLDRMVDELRVSLFTAGSVKTAFPVSEERIFRALDDLGA